MAEKILRNLTDGKYAVLKADIEANGIMVPILVDAATGEIIDGHHRKMIAEELGIDCPTQKTDFRDEADKEERALALNMMRRQLTAPEWTRAYRRILELRGVQIGGKGGGDRRSADTVSAGSAAGVAKELGVDPRTARRRVQQLTELEQAGRRDLVEKIAAGKIGIGDALRRARGPTVSDAIDEVLLPGREAEKAADRLFAFLRQAGNIEWFAPIQRPALLLTFRHCRDELNAFLAASGDALPPIIEGEARLVD